MLRRKIEQKLNDWYLLPKKPALLIRGARQVGKTTSIRKFGKETYENFIEINFERTPSLKSIFHGDLDADTIIEKMSVSGLGRLVSGKTLIFLDEIQSCPNARTAIKFLVEDGRFDIVESGSLLGINYEEVSSFPVGYELKTEMHSLDFEEFLWANDIPDSLIEKLRSCFESKTAIDQYIHETILSIMRRYIIVGGMPGVVVKYLESRNIADTILYQKMIVESYRDDISKYAGNQKAIVKAIFDSIPMQLSGRNKKFKLSFVEEGGSFRKYEEPLQWLFDAGIASFCYNLNGFNLPLELNEKRRIFKFFMRDTGLLSYMSLGNVQKAILSDNLKINEGALTENMIADLLVKNGYNLHYYDQKGRVELDFIMVRNNQLTIVEVKSGNTYKNHPSLINIININKNKIGESFVLCKGNIETVNDITYLPLYMAMFL
jgi:predicted AAA+ superfamily ATPase